MHIHPILKDVLLIYVVYNEQDVPHKLKQTLVKYMVYNNGCIHYDLGEMSSICNMYCI